MTDKTINDMMDLDWANPKPHLWMAFLPTITGYMHPRYANAFAEGEKHGDTWGYQLDISVKADGTAADIVFLTNKDFNEDFDIPAASTAEGMMSAVDNLTTDDIVRVLTAKGFIE